MEVKLTERIVASNDILHGKPRIAGTRVQVFYVLGLMAAGKSVDDIISDDYYPEITREDVLACVDYAMRVIENETFVAVP